ncbi:MAG: hypothetical protein U0271_38185 [Polyangiaceae bacterium]
MDLVGDVLPILLFLGFLVLVTFPILRVVRGSFRRHDPARAVASVELSGVGPFRLELPRGSAGTLAFRFEIDGDTDAAYDLVVRGSIERDGAVVQQFAWRTQEASSVAGAETASPVTTTHAVSNTRGSIELAPLDGQGGVVVGVVAEGTPGLLERGWVYVPKEG